MGRKKAREAEKLKNNQTSNLNLTGSKLFVVAGLSHLHLPEHSLLANLTLFSGSSNSYSFILMESSGNTWAVFNCTNSVR